MNRFESWAMRKLIRKAVYQDGCHSQRIKEIYKAVKDNARERFTEDNRATLNSYLIELHTEELA